MLGAEAYGAPARVPNMILIPREVLLGQSGSVLGRFASVARP